MKPIILITTAALLLPTFSKAATATFLPTGAGVWNDAANWSSGVIPNNDTPTVGTLWDVTIPIPASNSGNATIAISTSTSTRDLQFESAVLTQTTGAGDALGCSHYLLLNANLTTTGNVSLVFQNAPASGRLYIGGPGTWINRGTVNVPDSVPPSLGYLNNRLTVSADIDNYGSMMFSEFGEVYFERVSTDERSSYTGRSGSLISLSSYYLTNFDSLVLEQGATMSISAPSHVSRFGTFFGGGNGDMAFVAGIASLHGNVIANANSCFGLQFINGVDLSGTWTIMPNVDPYYNTFGEPSGLRSQNITISAPFVLNGGGRIMVGGQTGSITDPVSELSISSGASIAIAAGTTWQQAFDPQEITGGDIKVHGIYHLGYGGSIVLKAGGRIVVESGGRFTDYSLEDGGGDMPGCTIGSGGELRIKSGGIFDAHKPIVITGTGQFINEGNVSIPAGTNYAFSSGTSTGTITVPMGSSLSLGNFTLAAGAVLNNSGSVSFDGAVTSANPLSVTGTIAGSGSLTISELTITSGTLSPGNSPGTLTINGALSLTPATVLEFDLGTACDKVVVTGNGSKSVVLDGTLNITAGAGFGTGSYTLFEYAGVGAGAVDNGITFGAMPAGYQYYIEVNEGQRKVLLHVVNTLPSLPAWKLAQLGNVNAPDSGDPDGDGLSTLAEYGLGLLAGTPDISGRPHPSAFDFAEGRRMRLLVQRDPTRNDVIVDVEAAPGVAGPWTIVASSALGAPFIGPGYVGGDNALPGLKTVEIRDVENMTNAAKRFLRVKVTH